MTINAQNELYIKGDNDVSSVELYVNNTDGTNPTLFVKGNVENYNGVFVNNSGEIEVTGNFTNTANGSDAYYESDGIERFSGSTPSTITGNMNGLNTKNNFYNLKIDKDAKHNNVYYYRLNQIDLDGASELSNVVSASIKAEGLFNVMVYPNPNKENEVLTLEVNSTSYNDALVFIYDIQGKIISQHKVGLSPGINQFEIDNSQLSEGNYFVKIATKENTQSKHITVHK